MYSHVYTQQLFTYLNRNVSLHSVQLLLLLILLQKYLEFNNGKINCGALKHKFAWIIIQLEFVPPCRNNRMKPSSPTNENNLLWYLIGGGKVCSKNVYVKMFRPLELFIFYKNIELLLHNKK